MLQEKEVVEKMFNALLQAKAALEMFGGKKKPPTEFIPIEVLAYRIVADAIESATGITATAELSNS